MIVFTTFTSTGYTDARDRIIKEVTLTGLFDKVYTYNETELTQELLSSPTFKIKKGLGYYSWKPDIIWQTFDKVNEGDIIVYLDAGCTVCKSKEWEEFFECLNNFDVLAFRLHQRNFKWTRKSVFEHFADSINSIWKESFQYGANALILKKSNFSLNFISEWRDYMINRLDLCGEVNEDERKFEDSRFILNRYDQTILTALIYKYKYTGKIFSKWEHFEGYDPFRKQAFTASRIRNNGSLNDSKRMKIVFHGLVKQYLFYPFMGNYIANKYK